MNYKKLLTLSLSALLFYTTQAQENHLRLKTNPLSLILAYEPNANLSLEYYRKKEQYANGIQFSAAYIYDWLLLNKDQYNVVKNVSGFIGTLEYRAYVSQGFYIGPYLQTKSVKCNDYRIMTYTPAGTNYISQVNVSKTATSGGLLMGYQFKMGKDVGSEIQVNTGISRKQLYQNGKPIEYFEQSSESSFSIIDRTGRYPQFIFTYKIYVNLN